MTTATTASVAERTPGAAPAGPSRGSRLLTSLAATVFLVVTLAALLAGVLVPRLAGATTYTVLTGSMSPAYPPGTLLVVRPVATDRVHVGDVITFESALDPVVITHRVVRVEVDAAGQREFVVRGDANTTDDAASVPADRVRGTVWYAVPWLGRVPAWLAGGPRRVLTDVLAVALIGFGARSLVRGLRDRSRPAQEVSRA